VISTAESPPGHSFHVRRGSGRTSTYQDAIDILKGYGIWDKVPESVRTHLKKADPRYECIRSGELDGKPQYDFRVMGPEYMLEAARRRAEELGLNATIIASSLNDVEARGTGEIMASIAQEVEAFGRPFEPPCALIFGGELLVAVGKATGVGGRNQEFVLSSAPRIEGSRNIVIASADSDGNDGPTDVAGGIVDGYTMERAKEVGVDVFKELDNHNSYGVLEKLGDTVIMGTQGTNVRDLRVVYVGSRP
jgi:glycerate-2-kinase